MNLTDLTDVWLVATICVSILALLWACFRTVEAIFKTNRYLSFLKKARKKGGYPMIREEWLRKKGLPLAQTFDDLLVEVPVAGSPHDKKLKRCGSASEVFNPSSLAHGLVGNRFLLSMPGILTGLGVLGTFVGLQIGIGGLELDASQIEKLDKSITPIIKGCSTAFATSVWGVVCSLVFMVIEKFLEGMVLKRIRTLQSFIDQLIPRYTPEESMLDLQRSSAQSESLLKGLAVAIGDEMQKAIGRLGSSITDAVKESLGDNAKDLGALGADLMSKALTEELGKLQAAVTGMANGFKDDFLGASTALHTTINRFDGVLANVQNSVQTASTTTMQAVDRLNENAVVVEQLGVGAASLNAAATSLASLKETFDRCTRTNLEVAKVQEEAAIKNDTVATQFQSIGEKLPEVQKSISEGAQVIASLGQPLLDLKDVLATTPKVLGDQAAIQSTRDEQRSQLLLAQTEKLAATVGEAAKKFAEVETLAENLTKSANHLNEAGESLAKLSTSIEEASREHSNAAKSSASAAQAGQTAADKLTPLPETLQTVSSTLENAGSQITRGAEAAREVYKEMIDHQKEWFRGIEAGLSAMRDRVQGILDAYGSKVEETTQTHMDSWIKAVNTSLNGFQTHIETLEGAIHDLTSTQTRS